MLICVRSVKQQEIAVSSAQGSRQSVAVVGVGGIGAVMAGSIAGAGRHDVIACVRESIENLVVERPEGEIHAKLGSLTNAADAHPVDWVVLATKAHQTASVAPWLARLCKKGTCIAVLQNGIEHLELLRPYAGEASILPSIVYYNGERIAPGRVRYRPVTDFDLTLPDTQDAAAFAALLEGTSMRLSLSKDFAALAWRKLLINAVANPITALTLQRQSVLRRQDIKAQCLAILREAVTVGRASGVDLSEDEADKTLATLLTYPAAAGTSMYFDRLSGRPLEVEALTGAIVSAGHRCGVPTPLNSMLLTLLRAVSDASDKPIAQAAIAS